MFFAKNLEPSPIKITLPHVKRVTSWKPITKSVNIKLIKSAGKYLTPRSAGAQKLKASKLVKFGGCGTKRLAAKAKNIPTEIFK